MLKFMGAALIMISAGLFGIKKYNGFYERRRNLSLLRDGAEKIENSLRCMCLPLYECFLSAGSFFEKAAMNMSGGLLPSEAVEKALSDTSVFEKEDREVIRRFADGLSAFDREGQLKNVSRFISEIDVNISHAQNDVNTKGNLFLKGSILFAAAVVLMII